MPAVNETVIRVAADKLVTLGLADSGYTYLNIDGEWRSCSATYTGHHSTTVETSA